MRNRAVRFNYIKSIHILFPLLFSMLLFVSYQPDDPPQEILNALKTGNSAALSQYFNTNIELAMPSQDDIYSKQQAELIIRDFFTKHVPTNFVLLHKGGKEESQYAIGTLSTKSGNYRVTFLIKLRESKPYIHQLRFEQENAN